MCRVFFHAGADAYAHGAEAERQLRRICVDYSADLQNLEQKMAARARQEEAKLKQLSAVRRAYIESEATALQAGAGAEAGPLIYESQLLSTDDLTNLRKQFRALPRLLVLVAAAEQTALLFSDGAPDCGKLVKDNAPVWNGKGGGRPDNARVLFAQRQDLDCFLDFLRKAVR
jgi:alanyl-tRNA synthetase